jgi:hypothetical protein
MLMPGGKPMNKKILLVSILSLVMLLTISFASAINTNNIDADKKESPLYRIRTRRVIGEKIGVIIENIRTNFLVERIFFLQSPLPRRTRLWPTTPGMTVVSCPTCGIAVCKC